MPSPGPSDRGATASPIRVLVGAYMVGLLFLHQDFWLRDDASLVLGFLPASLAYHILYTMLAALGWFLVTRFAWPHHLERVYPPGERKDP